MGGQKATPSPAFTPLPTYPILLPAVCGHLLSACAFTEVLWFCITQYCVNYRTSSYSSYQKCQVCPNIFCWWLNGSVWMFIMFVAKQTLQRVHCHVRGQLFAVAVRQVTQSLVHNEECILWLKPMGSIYFFQSGFKRGGSSVLKGGGYLILPEQTCNVQGHIETI